MILAAIPTLDTMSTARLADFSISAAERAILENLRWEERVSGARLARYAQGFTNVNVAKIDDVKSAHVRYAEEYLELDINEPGVPDTFGTSNADNRWTGIEENLYLLRIEDANFALRDSGVDLTELERAVTNRDNAILQRVCQAWNANRDRRPAFATTEITVKDLLVSAGEDWTHALRDNLGLGHFDPATGSPPIPVLLMQYAVGAVTQDRHSGASGFAIPTVIDGRLNPYFFPTPRAKPGSEAAQYEVGRAINLAHASNQTDYQMGLELVHSFLEYRPEHILRIGYISRPLNCDLSTLRSLHLAWLKSTTERDDFAAG